MIKIKGLKINSIKENKEKIVIYSAIILFGLIFILNNQLHTDVLFFIFQSKVIITNGMRLYSDIIDINTPLSYLHTYLPVYISIMWGLDVILTYKILGISTMLLIYWGVYYRYLKIIEDSFLDVRFRCLGVVSLITLMFVGIDWAQRDFWAFFLIMPYILQSYITVILNLKETKYFKLLVSILAVLGVNFKFNYLLIIIGIEFYLLLIFKAKSIKRLEFVSFVSGGVISLSLIYLCFPEYIMLLLKGVGYYSGFKYANSSMLMLEIFLLVLMFIVYLSAYSKQIGRKVMYWGGVILFVTLSALIQNKGFVHHFLGLRLLLTNIFLLILVSRKVNKFDSSIYKHLYWSFSYLSIALLLIIWLFQLFEATHPVLSLKSKDYLEAKRIVTVSQNIQKDNPVSVLTSSFYPFSIILPELGVTNPIKYPNFWILPGMYKDQSRTSNFFRKIEDMSEDEQVFFDNVINGLISNKPVTLLVDNCYPKSGWQWKEFNYIDYFSQDERFRSFFSNFKKDPQKFGCFEVWHRQV